MELFRRAKNGLIHTYIVNVKRKLQSGSNGIKPKTRNIS